MQKQSLLALPKSSGYFLSSTLFVPSLLPLNGEAASNTSCRPETALDRPRISLGLISSQTVAEKAEIVIVYLNLRLFQVPTTLYEPTPRLLNEPSRRVDHGADARFLNKTIYFSSNVIEDENFIYLDASYTASRNSRVLTYVQHTNRSSILLRTTAIVP
jgi:hypothetical protein